MRAISQRNSSVLFSWGILWVNAEYWLGCFLVHQYHVTFLSAGIPHQIERNSPNIQSMSCDALRCLRWKHFSMWLTVQADSLPLNFLAHKYTWHSAHCDLVLNLQILHLDLAILCAPPLTSLLPFSSKCLCLSIEVQQWFQKRPRKRHIINQKNHHFHEWVKTAPLPIVASGRPTLSNYFIINGAGATSRSSQTFAESNKYWGDSLSTTDTITQLPGLPRLD